MTFDTNTLCETNYEYAQMLGKRACWTKSSIFSNFSTKLSAQRLLEDLRASKKGEKIAAKIYFEGLDKFVCGGFRYEFLGFA